MRVLLIRIPAPPPYNLLADLRIHDLEPAAGGIEFVPAQLSVSELLEPLAGGLGGVAAVGAEQPVEGVEGGFVGFALALDELVPFQGGEHFAELEWHFGGGG